MRILLTGSSGFTGMHFQSTAVSMGHEVISFRANLTDLAALKKNVELYSIDAVVHLAAISFVGHSDDSELYAVNTVGTTNLLEALSSLPKERRPTKVLVASSANIYGNCRASPISEVQPPAPVNHYAASKLAMEHMARTFLDRLAIVTVRPFNYTGPGQSRSFLIPKLVDHFIRKAHHIELGNLDVEREFNDIRTVCEAYVRLLTSGVPGETYNICSGVPHQLRSVIDLLSGMTGHKAEIRVNPAFVRGSEVHRLCGDNRKLLACIGQLTQYKLEDTLRFMLDAHHDS